MHILSGFTYDEEPSTFRRKPKRKVQVGPLWQPVVDQIDPGSAGAQAGLQKGDLVLEGKWPEGDRARPGDRPGEEGLRRADFPPGAARSTSTVTLTVPALPPVDGKPPADIPGVEWGKFEMANPTPFEQVGDSIRAMRNMIGAILSRKGDIGAGRSADRSAS